MKKSGNFWIFLIVLYVLLWVVISILSAFGGLDGIRLLGDGSLWLGILKIPFCIFGGIQVFRGFISVLDKDVKAIDASDLSQRAGLFWAGVLLICTLLGIFLFFEAFFTLI